MKLATLFVALFALAACGDDHGHKHGSGGHDHGHDHKPKHGGDLVELGLHEGFLELKHDASAATVKVWAYLGEEMKDSDFEKPPVMNMVVEGKPRQFTATKSGSQWMFEAAAFKSEPKNAKVSVSVGGKTYSVAWDHEHGHKHDHDGHGHDHGDGHGHDHDGPDHGEQDHDHKDGDHDHGDHDHKDGDHDHGEG